MKNFKKTLTGLLIFLCLLVAEIAVYQPSWLNLASPKLQANWIKKTPLANLVAAPTATPALQAKSALAKTTKPRILSAREKYEAFLNQHPFNNRVREVDDIEVEGEDKEAREERKEAVENNPDRPDLAFEQDFLRTMDPALQRPTPEVLTDVIKKNHPSSLSDAITPRMPGDNTSAATNWKELGPNNVGGRTRAIAWDPTTPYKVWAGGVSGGLWYNNDIRDVNASWVRVDDFWATLSITKIVFDPNNALIAYASTGEGFNAGQSIGAGIWKTTNGGGNWTQLPTLASISYVNDIVVRNETGTSVIYAAFDGQSYNGTFFNSSFSGLWRSADGGANWTQVLPKIRDNGSGFNSYKYVPSSINLSATRIWVGTKGSPYGLTNRGGGTVLYSFNGINWILADTLAGASGGRVTVASAPSDSNYIYSFMQNADNNGVNVANNEIVIRKSTDNGVSWTDIAKPDDADNGIAASDFTRGQAAYDQALSVDPNDPTTVIIGGIDLFRSTDEGVSWPQISRWSRNPGLSGKPYSIVHADQHAISFKPGSSTEVIFGNDGGVFYSSDITNAAIANVITARNKNYNVTQFYSAAIHPTAGNNSHLAGAQDNGTQQFNTDGINATIDVTGGDGGYCFVDQYNPNFQISSYVFNTFYRSTDGGSHFSNLLSDGATGSFINPACYDNNQHVLYSYQSISPTKSIYRVKDITSTPVTSTITVTNLTSAATAFKVSPYTTSSTTLFIGTSSGKLIKLTNANGTPVEANISGSSPNALPVGSISCIEIGRNENELLVTFFNYGINKIYYSSNGGTTWVSKMGNFPNMPVRWALFNPNHPTTEVILATELGVYGTTNFDNASNPTWTAQNTGFANVRTNMLQMRTSDYMVIAATHGRGLFSSMGFSEAAAPTISSFTPTSAGAGGPVTITGTNLTGAIAVSFGDAPAASFTVDNSTTISAIVNTGNCGSVNVITPGGIATKTGFSFILPAPTASVSVQPTCTLATGTVALTGLPASGNWTVTATGGATIIGTGTTGNFTGLAAGTYTLTVSIGACTSPASSSVIVNAQPVTPAVPSASVSIQPTCTLATGTVALTGLPSGNWTVTATGGATKTGSGTTGNFTGLAAGTYTFTVSNGACTSPASSSVIVNAQPVMPTVPSALVSIQPSCATSTGTVALSGLPASGNWIVTASTGTTITGTGTTGTFSGLAAGTYTFTVSNSACTSTASSSVTVNVQPANSATPTASVTAQPTCASATGTITVSSPTANLTFSINGSDYSNTNGIFTTVAAGTYNVTAKNTSGCTSAAIILIVNAQPASPITPIITITQPTCSTATGIINITSAGGIGDTYSINDATYQLSNTFNSVATATYNVTVKSAGGCISSATVAIVAAQPSIPTTPTITASNASPLCAGTANSLTSSSVTGNQWYNNGVAIAGATNQIYISSLGGSFTVIATNASGCSSAASTPFAFTVNPAPTAVIAQGAQLAFTDCATTSLTLTATTDAGSPSYQWYRNAALINAATSSTYNATLAGNYTVVISGNGCSNTSAATNIASVPTVSVTGSTVICQGTGVLLSTGSTGSYQWQVKTTGSYANVASGGTSATYNAIISGDYQLILNGTSTSCPITVTVNPLPTVSVAIAPSATVCAGSTSTLTATATGATPYTYQWKISGVNIASATSAAYSAQTSGVYTVKVTDNNGCQFTTSNTTITVNPAVSSPTVGTITQPTCSTATGTVVLNGLPTGNWTITPSVGTAVNGTGSSFTFTSLTAATTYTFTVTNSLSCTSLATTSVVVNAKPATPAAPVATITQPLCSTATGIITLSGSAGDTYTIAGGNYQSSNTFHVFAGNYSVTIRNASGCSSAATSAVVIAQFETPAIPTASVTAQPTCTVATGTITVSSPTTNLTFSINGTDYSNTNGIFTPIATGTYNLTAKNANGCSSAAANLTVFAHPTTPTAPTASVTVQPTCSTITGTVALSGLPASDNWTVTASGGASITGTGTTGTFSGLAAGDYTFIVSNSSCSSVASSSVTVNAPPANPAAPTASVTAQPTCNVATGTITISSSVIGLTCSIDGADYSNTSGIFTNVVAGTYTITVRNTIGCTSAATIVTVTAQPASTNNTVSLSSVAGTNAQTTCINTAISNITYATIGATGATFSGLVSSVTGAWSANIATISGTPNAAGTFNYTVLLTGGCGNTTATGSITAIPNNTIRLSSSAGSDNQTNCTNTLITPITFSTVGATGATFSGLPVGVSGVWSANGCTISGTPTVAGTFNYTVTLNGGCGNIEAAGIIIAKAIAISPSITAGSSSFCPGGSMLLTSSAATGNQWYKNGSSIAGANAPTYAADAIGSYTVSNFINGCNSFPSDAKIITASNIVSPPIITALSPTEFCNGDTLKLASNTTTGILWQLNGSIIVGASNATYFATDAGDYTVLVTANGCTSAAIKASHLLSPNKPTLSAASAKSFCVGDNVTLISNETRDNFWYKDGVFIKGATGSTYTASTSGYYTDTIVNSIGCKAGSLPTNIIVKAVPQKPLINWNGATLSTSSSASAFQWSVNNVTLFGATLSTYKPLTIGWYKIHITNSDGCNNISDSFNLVVTAINNPATTSVANMASVFPNPASPVLLVKFRETPNTTLEIRLITGDGRSIQLVKTKEKLTTIPINNVPSGKYYIRITGKNYNQTESVIINK